MTNPRTSSVVAGSVRGDGGTRLYLLAGCRLTMFERRQWSLVARRRGVGGCLAGDVVVAHRRFVTAGPRSRVIAAFDERCGALIRQLIAAGEPRIETARRQSVQDTPGQVIKLLPVLHAHDSEEPAMEFVGEVRKGFGEVRFLVGEIRKPPQGGYGVVHS